MEEQEYVTEGTVNENADMTPQCVIAEDGSPYLCKPHGSVMQNVSMFAFPLIIGLIYLAIITFLIVMFYRLVKATEKIAAKLESGIAVKKETTETTI